MWINFAQNLGFKICGVDYSPIKDPEGNIEYLAHFSKNPAAAEIDWAKKISAVVDAAHKNLMVSNADLNFVD